MRTKTTIISTLIIAAWLTGAYYYLSSNQETVLYNIKAHSEPELADPAYAQFVYSENITLNRLYRLSGLTIPIYSRNQGTPFAVSLLHNSALLQTWTVTTNQGTHQFNFPLDTPTPVDGVLTITIDANHIPADESSLAPAVFIEKDANAFPQGHYQIANNIKQGNISLILTQSNTRLELLLERLNSKEKLIAFSQIIMWLSLAILTLQGGFVLASQNPFRKPSNR
ncbi:MAG: hypothetical protein U1C49_01065 [Candidatus Andersenbacteria bacterium]|nr:hypothetical protein [bacterium]MDZ4225417.1 hypothetical protein [Candidatus Andersenbacteria bacterium]